ncbi:hypothetical protein BKA69DRAFT_1066920 [Paraphysoderma sedebokerense]|nr:hypothetical protein BKA69DRAFT_1066920 [Paraphysoderma sedebokerense]
MAEVKPQTSPVAQPTSKSPTTAAQPEKRPASPSATHPILFATKSNLFLHFNPPEAPHLRFAPQPKDTDPNYQFLLLKYEPNKSPVSIRKVEDGMKVLLCLNEPRWYAGFKSDGQLFLLNTPTTLTLWTIKVQCSIEPSTN